MEMFGKCGSDGHASVSSSVKQSSEAHSWLSGVLQGPGLVAHVGSSMCSADGGVTNRKNMEKRGFHSLVKRWFHPSKLQHSLIKMRHLGLPWQSSD